MNGLGLKPDPYFPPKKARCQEILLWIERGPAYVLVVAKAIHATVDDHWRISVLQ
jgi:hypothetical protein